MAVTSNSGRLHDLTEANRFDPNLERERELLALRHHVAVERLQHPGPLRPVDPARSGLQFEDALPVVHAHRGHEQVALRDRSRRADRAPARHGEALSADRSPGTADTREPGS